MDNFLQNLTAALWIMLSPILAALAPLLIGLFLASCLHPAVSRLQPRMGAGPAIFTTYALCFLFLISLSGGFAVLITGSVPTDSPEETIDLISDYFHDASAAVSPLLSRFFPAEFQGPTVSLLAEEWIAAHFSIDYLSGLFMKISSFAISFFLGIAASIYLLRDREYFLLLWDQFLSIILKQRTHGILCELLSEIRQVIAAFLKGVFIDSLLIAFLSSAVLTVLQIRFAAAIGILAGMLNVIPYFGPVIAMIPAGVAGLLSGGPVKAAAAVLLLFLIQQADSTYIYPRIVGRSTGLHPLFILLSVSICGYFFGLAGILLAVPAAGIIQVLVRYLVFR